MFLTGCITELVGRKLNPLSHKTRGIALSVGSFIVITNSKTIDTSSIRCPIAPKSEMVTPSW